MNKKEKRIAELGNLADEIIFLELELEQTGDKEIKKTIERKMESLIRESGLTVREMLWIDAYIGERLLYKT